jgi:hypothetical protein
VKHPHNPDKSIGRSRPVSRVLSWTVIHLGYVSPRTSSNLPESSAGRTNGFLFGLAPSGVYRAANCYQLRGALLPHPFTLTGTGLLSHLALRRSALCCTFRRLAPPRRYLALCPMEPGLSSTTHLIRKRKVCAQRLPGQLRAAHYSPIHSSARAKLPIA